MAPRAYDFKRIESKWQAYWEEQKLFRTDPSSAKPKYYNLMMFPYPSSVLHVGHGRNYILGDVLTRYKLMRGFNVLSPMGWDAFGLPAENAAIRDKTPPAESVNANIANIKLQLKAWGIGYDWDREVATCHPGYYKWTQWVFLVLYKQGLAYKKMAPVNWCPSCNTTLANEEVVEGNCERCGAEVVQRKLEQWFFKITEYAQRLLDDLSLLDQWPEKVRTMQANWIGRSEGARVDFKIAETGDPLPCFTTRPDTLWGVTFMAMAPEHPMIESLVAGTPQEATVKDFVRRMRTVSARERAAEAGDKEGVFTGKHVINPVNGDKVPLWVTNYALMEYGTGAVMAVPAHDQRDFEFAKQYGLDIRVVIEPKNEKLDAASMTEAFVEDGVQADDSPFAGMPNREAIDKIITYLEEKSIGAKTVNYRIRDWLISRQRYWGAPIPIIYCDKCGTVPVSEKDLPVELPEMSDFVPKGKAPLATVPSFVNTTCPECGGPATRETDTIAQWLCSCWYFLRYLSPRDDAQPFDRELVDKWLPVDQYVGGVEHAVLHLLYSRFIVKVLHDAGYVGFVEPFGKLFTQGMICKEGFRCPALHNAWVKPEEVNGGKHVKTGADVVQEMAKMSKSKFNVVSPDDLIETYGADTERLYTLFIGPPEKDAEWSDQGVVGASRFLNRLWDVVTDQAEGLKGIEPYRGKSEGLPAAAKDLRRKVHATIEKVTRDCDGEFHFNTSVSMTMELLTELRASIDTDLGPQKQQILREAVEALIIVLSPFVPHICDELWQILGNKQSILTLPWPEYDPDALKADEVEIIVQVNGKVRGRLSAAPDADEDTVRKVADGLESVCRFTEGKTVRKVIYVPGKLLNIVAT